MRRVYKRKYRNGARRRPKVTAKAITNVLVPWKVIKYTYGQGHTTVGYTTSGGGCKWFTTELYTGVVGAREATTTVLLGDIQHALDIADHVFPSIPKIPNEDKPGFVQEYTSKYMLKGRVIYTLRNQANETEILEAYTCIVRKDKQFARNGDLSQPNNVYDVFAQGLGIRGAGQPKSSSTNLTYDITELFQSPTFCKFFKVVKRKVFTIKAGEQKAFGLSMKTQTICPSDITVLAPDAVDVAWVSKQREYNYRKGSRFIIFKIKARIAGYVGQAADLDPMAITYTTPTIIMQSQYHYKARMIYTQGTSDVVFQGFGTQSQTAAVMLDNDFTIGNEVSAAG